jgi:hypothetical protein
MGSEVRISPTLPRAAPLTVFICHSAIGDAAATSLIKALQAALEPDCVCFVDWTELDSGKTWRDRIDPWLQQCDAGIVVLNHSALVSPFVAYEVSELARRWNSEADTFELIPVHVKNADPKKSVGYNQLKTCQLGPWKLDEISAEVYDPAQDPDASSIVARIAAKTALATARRVQLAPHVEAIVDLLNKVPDKHFRAAVGKTASPLRELRPVTTSDRVNLAKTLCSLGLKDARPVIEALCGDMCARDKHWDERDLSMLLSRLATVWVRPEAAAAIEEVARGPHDYRNVALAARHERTAMLHVNRACATLLCNRDWFIAPVQAIGGEELGDDEFLTAKVRRVLIDQLTSTDDELNLDLEDLDAVDKRVFVTLSSIQPSPTRVSRLRTDFKPVTFVYMTRGAPGAAPAVDPRVRHLEPVLDATDEDRFHETYDRSWRQLRPRCPDDPQK